MSVDTTPIPPVIPGTTTVPEAIDSANTAFGRIRDVSILANANEVAIGDVGQLETSDKTSLVAALNSVYSEFLNGFLLEKITGNLLDLTTTSKNNLVAAINEHDKEIGNLNALQTPSKSSLVSAINSIASASTSIGDMSILMTQDRFTLVGAINDVYRSVGFIGNLATGDDNLISAVNKNHAAIGDMSALITTRKNSLVEAINELKVRADGFLKLDGTNSPSADINFNGRKLRNLGLSVVDTDAVPRGQVAEIARTGNLNNLQTQNKNTLVNAINEVVVGIGSLSGLKTAEKSSIVNAINELYDNIGYSDKQENLELVSTVNFGRGVGTSRNQSFNFFSTPNTTRDYDFRIQRMAGDNGHAVFDNRGTGMFNFGFVGTYRVRIQNDANNPLQVLSGGTWKNIAFAGDYLTTTGGILTGTVTIKPDAASGGIAIQPSGTKTGMIVGYNPAGQLKWSIGEQDANGPVELKIGNGTSGWKIDGNLDVAGTITTPNDISGLSDASLKSDVETINDGLSCVSAMRGVKYNMHGSPGRGVIAQELEKIDPHLVHTNHDGIKSVKYMQLAGYFIEAIKELKSTMEYENRLLREEIKKLKGIE
uniref:Tail fiber protein n=1 Tax=Rhizobium phage IG49 TaxID=3129228 RepID=A0AAU8HYX4_9CAUD